VSRYKKSNAPSIRSPVVDEEKAGPGHCLGLVLCGPYRVLTLTYGLPIENSVQLIPEVVAVVVVIGHNFSSLLLCN